MSISPRLTSQKAVTTLRFLRRDYRQPLLFGAIILFLLITSTLLQSCYLSSKALGCPEGLECPEGTECAARQLVCILDNCGDGIADEDERCDDGNIIAGDGCSADCKSSEICGNEIVDLIFGEQCDRGDRESGDGCSADCRFETCGNGILDTAIGEICDDGNTVGGDGCSADCMSDESCPNGIVDVGEQCEPPTQCCVNCRIDPAQC